MTPERRPNILLLSALIVILLAFVLFEPAYGWKLRQFFTPSDVMPQAASLQAAPEDLLTENDQLKAQLAELQGIAAQLPTSSQAYTRAMVYSRYPLNFRNELFVDAGANDGIATGSAVIYQGVLVGRIADVWSDYAAVQTVFDNDFRMPVRVGAGGYDGLLTGGSYPYIASIAKSATLQAGDVVYTAAAGVPYGLPVGEVQSTSTSPDNLFIQAELQFPYDVNGIQTVLIAK